jgi:hypothetical protein
MKAPGGDSEDSITRVKIVVTAACCEVIFLHCIGIFHIFDTAVFPGQWNKYISMHLKPCMSKGNAVISNIRIS